MTVAIEWAPLTAAPSPPLLISEEASQQRVGELKAFIEKEKPAFEKRESHRKNLVESLDRFNHAQNKIRERIQYISTNQQEMTMALENLELETQKQKELIRFEKERLLLIFKVAYQVKRDGLLPFLLKGKDLSLMANRVRVLYRTLQRHTLYAKKLEERSVRLAKSNEKLARAQFELTSLLTEMQEQEQLLKNVLIKKQSLLTSIREKQSHYEAAVQEYKRVAVEVRSLFDSIESHRSEKKAGRGFPKKHSLPLPVDEGQLVRNFGTEVNEKFGTIVNHKGVEIATDLNAPVRSVLAGTIEFEGWVKGLGNVIIVHHGSGFYSLSAHLFKSLKTRGTQVEQGDLIGLAGDTGSNSKPGIYFELRENNKAVDPTNYFSTTALQTLG